MASKTPLLGSKTVKINKKSELGKIIENKCENKTRKQPGAARSNTQQQGAARSSKEQQAAACSRKQQKAATDISNVS